MTEEKKITAEQQLEDEKLSDDELDGVAGGTFYETADDSRFLNTLNGSTDRYGATKVSFDTRKGETIRKSIRSAWTDFGIEVKFGHSLFLTSNDYYLRGQKITQEEARQHAMKVTGRHLTESEWKW